MKWLQQGGVLLWVLLFASPLLGQSNLDRYVEEALSSNLALQDRSITVERSMVALQEAKSLFLPSATFMGNYTLAGGGRTIDFPIGDLLNPVYATLNRLTASQNFPQLNNETILLNPNNFYDAKVRITYPLLNTDISFNKQISEQRIDLAKLDVEAYRKELALSVAQAYYNYCMAAQGIDIYRSALKVLERQLRTMQSLSANGKALPAQVLRAESELMQLQAMVSEAENTRINARSYLNFLRNHALTDSVQADAPEVSPTLLASLTPEIDISNRTELASLSTAIKLNQTVVAMQERFRTPKVNIFTDLGSQAFNFQVSKKSAYYLMGLQVEVPIFQGKRNLYKIQSSQLAIKQLEVKKEYVSKQLELAASMARQQVMSAWTTWQAQEKRKKAAEAYASLVEKGFAEGIYSIIELLDANNQLTQASLQASNMQYKVLQTYTVYVASLR